MEDVFEMIENSREQAKMRRLNELKRFHIGDVAYPLYQYAEPLLWGIITEINVTTHKITVNLNGITRQYDPEELVLVSPEEKEPNRETEEKQRAQEIVEQYVKSAFHASRCAESAFEESTNSKEKETMSDENVNPADEIEMRNELEKISIPTPEETVEAAEKRAKALSASIRKAGKAKMSIKAFTKMIKIADELNDAVADQDVEPLDVTDDCEECADRLDSFAESCKKAAKGDEKVMDEKGSASFFDWTALKNLGFSRTTKLQEIDNEDKLKAVLKCVRKKQDAKGLTREFLQGK